MAGLDITEDEILGGRLRIRQYKQGYRVAIDPIFLAACLSVQKGDRVLDMGCGVGAASLCLAARVPGLQIVGIEKEKLFVDLAWENVLLNAMGSQVKIQLGDIMDILADQEKFTLIMANPPYLAKGNASPSPYPLRARANMEDDRDLSVWVRVAAQSVVEGGSVHFVHRWDRLDELVRLLEGIGQVSVLPLVPNAGAVAKRALVKAKKGLSGNTILMPPLILHQEDGTYTEEAQRILRQGAPIDLP